MADAEFASADAGASATFPIRAGEVKKGTYVIIKGHPCKVVEVTTSKTGKHGHAKANITALDIFTGQKLMDISPTSHNMEAPFVTNVSYSMLDIDEEGYVCLMDEEGNTREDLMFPEGDEYDNLKKAFEAGEEVTVTVQGALGIEKIMPTFKMTKA
jgi:translation initiation factor 5A